MMMTMTIVEEEGEQRPGVRDWFRIFHHWDHFLHTLLDHIMMMIMMMLMMMMMTKPIKFFIRKQYDRKSFSYREGGVCLVKEIKRREQLFPWYQLFVSWWWGGEGLIF